MAFYEHLNISYCLPGDVFVFFGKKNKIKLYLRLLSNVIKYFIYIFLVLLSLNVHFCFICKKMHVLVIRVNSSIGQYSLPFRE